MKVMLKKFADGLDVLCDIKRGVRVNLLFHNLPLTRRDNQVWVRKYEVWFGIGKYNSYDAVCISQFGQFA